LVTKATKALLIALVLSVLPVTTSANEKPVPTTAIHHEQRKKVRAPKPNFVSRIFNKHYFSRRLQIGEASWYGPGFQGKPTTSGAIFDTNKLSCAALGQAKFTVRARILVQNLRNGFSAICTVTDTGGHPRRIIDLSHAMKVALHMRDTEQVAIFIH
jgi:rare lipoprotein A (peptidoglycan hydrolase)